MEEFLRNYGYLAVFLFSCIEGEVALLLAGVACSQGIMELQFVIFYAFLGTCITEQIIFFVGRIYGNRLLIRFPKLKDKSQIVFKFLKKYDYWFIFSFRFIYGIRNVSPLLIGMSGIKPLKYSILNIPASIIWAISVACAGFYFSNIIGTVIENIHSAAIIILIIVLIMIARYIYKNKKKAELQKKNDDKNNKV